jgi:hypothetical protein
MMASAVACWKSCTSTMPLPFFFSLAITDCDLLRLAHFEVERVNVGGKDADIALAEIVDQLGWLPQCREAEIGRGRPAGRPVHGADPLLDLVLGVEFVRVALAIDEAGSLGLGQILMTPGMRTDRMSGRRHLLEDLGLVGDVQANGEEDRSGRQAQQAPLGYSSAKVRRRR